MRMVELEGKRFGKLLVIKRLYRTYRWFWLCRCDCGNDCIISGSHLQEKGTLSCGCLRTAIVHGNNTRKDGPTRLYSMWLGMKRRCYNKKDQFYYCYGERGITICNEWKSSFISFRDWALKSGYQDDLQIDRKNNSLGYSPGNCRFVSASTNMLNRRVLKINQYGFTGIRCFGQNKWIYRVTIKGKTIGSSYFKSKYIAVINRDIFILNNKISSPLGCPEILFHSCL